MSGTITRLTIIRHPILVCSLFGWRVVVVGLLGKPITFLDLLRAAHEI